ncbi:hypothetical protein N7453_009817 [Penicillium expansum]|nr:hypothetical protein N7453_009817 [Penicillium expansum]
MWYHNPKGNAPHSVSCKCILSALILQSDDADAYITLHVNALWSRAPVGSKHPCNHAALDETEMKRNIEVPFKESNPFAHQYSVWSSVLFLEFESLKLRIYLVKQPF